ncbi:BadF/BadG/BcrA/BcrD ATPase family protein [Streptomyces sp. MAR4 CNX-425]|uniref:BadF/BadG/BcrA/BcrD ATPase family protein n=1 Tax=Streptomyces sp. MAR4 CNX-425 TaxID=3406343 RepID=UPI003B50DF07
MEKLVIGIDAGGTSLRAALAPAAGGAVLRTASAGAGNPRSVPAEVLTERLTACVAPLAEAAGAGAGTVAAVVAGVAGADPRNPDDRGTRVVHAALRAALRRSGAGAAPVRVCGDAEIAFAAGPGAPASGVVVIAGTGASASRIADRRQTASTDGHGWLLGDEGSGFWIAREALRAALRALDGRGPATALAELLAAATGGGPGAGGGGGAEGTAQAGGGPGAPESGGAGSGAVDGHGPDGHGPGAAGARGRGRGPTAAPLGTGSRSAGVRMALVDAGFAGAPMAIARLCPVVVRAAEAGDAVAAAILDEAADRLAETAAVHAPVPGEPLVTTGGLLGPGGPLLPRFAARMRAYGLTPAPVPDGLAGAVALARAIR